MYNAQYLFQGKDRNALVVLLHGYSSDRDAMASVRDAAHDALPGADVYAPRLPFGESVLSVCMRSAESIVAELMQAIDSLIIEKAEAGKAYQQIFFVGHSIGAVLARRLAILAFGEQSSDSGLPPAPFEPELAAFRVKRPWAGSIRRVVLLAGMNRGWTVSSAADWMTSVLWGGLQIIGEMLLQGKPTIMAIRQGAPFLVQTRLQWLALMDGSFGPRPEMLTIQLLGTTDDQVAPDDNLDYSVDFTDASLEPSYFYIEMPLSNHSNVVQMSARPGTPGLRGPAADRRRRFILALNGSYEAIKAESVPRDHMTDNLPPPPDPKVTDLVFVVHGIRDKGFWTQKIARTIKHFVEQDGLQGERLVESWTESYGYFPMLPFMFRAARQRKVEWLMDRYAEARARYPRAVFHYVGHSNGTYLAAQALRDYPACRFDHIVFAGSVVRRDYDWMHLIRPGIDRPKRVGQVLNYVATSDWVVALFPKGVQPWRWFNLGSAGHDGFDQATPNGPVHEVKYIVGGHGAGHEEPHWNDIARFIIRGEAPPDRYPPFSRNQSHLWHNIGQVSALIFPAIAFLVLAIGAAVLYWIVKAPTGPDATFRMVVFLVYTWLVYIGITRF